MKLIVLRFSSEADSTHGLLFEHTGVGKKFLCYTLEDESRDQKVWGETCVPEGEYCINFRREGGYHTKYSKRFSDIHKGMLEVCDVPDFKYILLHCGNTDEDTAGCLLLGDTQENNNTNKNGFIGKSTQAYKRVYPKIAKALEEGDEVTIEYRDFKECLLLSPIDLATFIGASQPH